MIQLPTSSDAIVREVVARVTAALRLPLPGPPPWRMVLFGSRARGQATQDSDYDFYVEVEAADDDALTAAHDRIEDALSDCDLDVDLTVARRGSLERRRDDPGTLEWDVAREGLVLYSDPAASIEIAPTDRVREPSREPPTSAREWLQLAEKDRQLRDELWKLDGEYWAQICWLSQQTAEKHLKALLVRMWVRPTRTHKLVTLLHQLEPAGLALPHLRSDCRLLTKHAVAPRYGPGLKLRAHHARRATDAADRVIAAVNGVLGPAA